MKWCFRSTFWVAWYPLAFKFGLAIVFGNAFWFYGPSAPDGWDLALRQITPP